MTANSDDNASENTVPNKAMRNPSTAVLSKDQRKVERATPVQNREDSPGRDDTAVSSTSWWVRLARLFLGSAFTPQWFPEPWRHPALGYLLGLILQVIAVLATILIIHLLPTFVFPGLFEILGIALIALNFGTGPSLFSTFVSIALVNAFVLPPHTSSSFVQSLAESVLFLLIGATISFVASQVEQARRNAIEERTLLNAVIETMPDSVSVYDANRRRIRLNRAGRLLEERGIHNPAFSVTTGKLRTSRGGFFAQQELPVDRALQGELVEGVEMVWQPRTQETQYFIVSAAPLYNTRSQIAGVVSISHDVSALRLSERRAAASTSELEATFESITDGVFVFNLDGRIIRMNTAFRELVGIPDQIDYLSYTYDDEYKAFFTLLNGQGLVLPYEQWPQRRILRGESLQGPSTMDVLVRTTEGREILVNISGAPIYRQDGKLMGGVAVCRDITEHRQLETYTRNTLYALLEMAQTLIQGPEEPTQKNTASINTVTQRLVELTSRVLNCKRVGIISMVPESERLLPVAVVGLTPKQEELWWGYIPQLHLADMTDAIGVERLRNGEVVHLDAIQHQSDEQYMQHGPINSLLAPMTVGKKVVGLLSLDYVNDKQTYTDEEMALAGAVGKLAALVIERERLLLERSEAQANEIALSEANQRMNEFLGIASHELKTPITTIKGSTQLLERRLKKMMDLETMTAEERTRLQEEAQDLLRRTNTQVNRLTRLINDLLDMSRIQAHKIEPHIERANLISVLQDVVQEQSRGSTDRIITLQLPSESEVFVRMDIDRIEQVLTNFISNALKYSEADKPVAVVLQKRGQEAYVAVHDAGPGLPGQERENVFERFYRVKGIEVRSGSGVGLGLGLYISKTIIDLHNGRIGVDSEVGKGSTFWFTLPLAD